MEDYGIKMYEPGTMSKEETGSCLAWSMDNAATMVLCAKLAGKPRVACSAHAHQRMILALLNELNLKVLLELLNTYCSVAAGLCGLASAAGIDFNLMRTMIHKFGFALPALREVIDKYDTLVEFVRDNAPRGVAKAIESQEKKAARAKAIEASRAAAAKKGAAKKPKTGEEGTVEAPASKATLGDGEADDEAEEIRRNRLTSWASLKVELADPTTRPRLLLFVYLVNPALEIITASEAEAGAVPADFVSAIKAYKALLAKVHADPEDDIDMAISEAGVTLTPTQYADVQSRVERGIEEAYLRFEVLEASLPAWERQEAWHPANEPPSSDDEIKAAAGCKLNLGNKAELLAQATRYHAAWASGRWNDVVKPEQPPPVPVGQRRGKVWKKIHVNAIAFWNRNDVKAEFPLVRAVALHWFSYPLSQTCVERTFNILKKMARDDRLSMNDAGVVNELFVRLYYERIHEKLQLVLAAGAEAE